MATIDNLVTQARDLLQDTVEPYRFSDDRLIRSVNNAFNEAYRKRPDIFIDLDLAIPEVTITDDFPLDTQFFPAFIDYVVGFTELADDEFAVDGRATALMGAILF